LTSEHRKKINAQLLRADVAFDRAPDSEAGALAAMRQAFDGIAQVLLDAGILTEDLLREEILHLVWDSAIAGGWWRLASQSRQDIFPEKIGRYWVWREDNPEAQGLLRAEIRHWRADLLDAPPAAVELDGESGVKGGDGSPVLAAEVITEIRLPHSDPPVSADPSDADRGKKRSEWLDEKRGKKRWTSDLDIQNNGGPTYNTIQRYRSGVRSTRDAAVRLKLADAFDCTLEEVPN
jgi:hypothetical protein